MKGIMVFMMVMVGRVWGVMGEGGDVGGREYEGMIGRFGGLVGGVVVVSEGLKGLLGKMKGWVREVVRWCVGLVWGMVVWWVDGGFVSDVRWEIGLVYGFGG